MLAASIPNSATLAAFVDTATKWRAMSFSAAPPARNQARALAALVMVSMVVKVFEAITNRVRAGFTRASTWASWSPSTFETKCMVRARMAIGGERLAGHRRAQVRAADADVDHVADRFAGIAAPAPLAHRCGELADALAYRRHGRHHVLAIDLEACARRRAAPHAAPRGLRYC